MTAGAQHASACLPQQAYAAPADCPARRLAKLQAFAGRQRTLKTDACAVGLPVLACPRGPVRDPVHLCASARWAVATKNPAKRPPTRPAPSRQRPPSLALSATSRCRAAAAMCRFLVLPGRRMRASQPAGRMQAGWRRWSGGHWRRQRLQHSPVPHSLSFASSLSYRCIAGNTYIGVGTAMSRRCCLACTTPLNHRRRCPPFRRACSADYPACGGAPSGCLRRCACTPRPGLRTTALPAHRAASTRPAVPAAAAASAAAAGGYAALCHAPPRLERRPRRPCTNAPTCAWRGTAPSVHPLTGFFCPHPRIRTTGKRAASWSRRGVREHTARARRRPGPRPGTRQRVCHQPAHHRCRHGTRDFRNCGEGKLWWSTHLHSPPQRAPWSRCLRVAGSLAPGLHPPSPPPCLPACLPARPIAGPCSVRHRLPCDRWGTDSGWRRRQGAALLRQSLSIAGVLRRRRRRCR